MKSMIIDMLKLKEFVGAMSFEMTPIQNMLNSPEQSIHSILTMRWHLARIQEEARHCDELIRIQLEYLERLNKR